MKPITELGALRALFEDCRTAALGPVLFNVFDGDEGAFESPVDTLADVEKAAEAADDARLAAYTPAGKRLGWFYLVWGNAEDGEELISDYGVNEFTERVWELFQARYA